MSFNLMGLVLTILACSNLLSAEISDQKYNQENFDKYYDEWMADEGNISTQSTTSGNISTVTIEAVTIEAVTSQLTTHAAEAVALLNNQERLLNAVALIRQVLENANSSAKNKTELFKLAREVLPAGTKEVAASDLSQTDEAVSNEDEDETENYSDVKAHYDAEDSEKLKRDFWETNKEKYLKSLSSGKDESEKLTSDELDSFGHAIESRSKEKSLERMEEYASDIMKREGNTPKVETVTDSTVKGKTFIRRHLWLNRKAKLGLKNLRKAKLFNRRRKRIGELGYSIDHSQSESSKRNCGGPGVARRDVNGCGM